MSASSWILPLASVEEVRAELVDTEEKLARSSILQPVHRGRFAEWRATLLRWRERLAAQLAEMESGS